jgi:nitroreductase/dihydropteridine reductase
MKKSEKILSSIKNKPRHMELLEIMKWRYATKRYSNKKVPGEKIHRILDAIRLSASSSGIQPYRIFVIENTELRRKLSNNSFNLQIKEASHLLVFAAFESIDEKLVDDFISLTAKERNVPVESLELFKVKGLGRLLQKTPAEFQSWSTNQAYIALGTALVAAAAEKVDASPMEGFDPANFDQLLELKEKRLKSVVLMGLGYRDEKNDPFAAFKKVRWPMDEFATFIK